MVVAETSMAIRLGVSVWETRHSIRCLRASGAKRRRTLVAPRPKPSPSISRRMKNVPVADVLVG